MTHRPLVFLFDVDSTLLDEDAVINDLCKYLIQQVGQESADNYWKHFDKLRGELGYADYLGALQRSRDENPHEMGLLLVARYLIEYPFASKLFPQALDVVRHAKQWGLPVILSDGDVVFQPVKIDRAGLCKPFDEHVLIYIHKEKELAHVAQRYPADHYVFIDDNLRILQVVKACWGERVTTIHVCQGQDIVNSHILADITINDIKDFLTLGEDRLWGPGRTASSSNLNS